MTRLETRFGELRAQGRTALVGYITAGDPDPERTVAMMHALVAGGVDVIELGVPFSDPMADGPVIQAAFERALKRGVDLQGVLDMVTAFRRDDASTPVVLMGYLNPVEVMGYERFATAAAAAGVDGALTVDIPPEEAGDLLAALEAHNVDPVFLVAPTSSPERIARICQSSRGFVYYVSLKGVTGTGGIDTDAVGRKVAQIRQATGLPVGVGFGVRDPESAARVAAVADAVIVGSALVRLIEQGADDETATARAVTQFVHELRDAMDHATAAAASSS